MNFSEETLILGVDPGTKVTGYGIIRLRQRRCEVVDFGCIRPPVIAKPSEKYKIIFQGLNTLLDRHAISALSVETQYVHKNVQSGIKLGMARGVIVLAASLRDIPIFEYAPSRAKKAVVGHGNASKVQVQGMVQRLLSLSTLPTPEDAADALSLALCHAHVSLGNGFAAFQT